MQLNTGNKNNEILLPIGEWDKWTFGYIWRLPLTITQPQANDHLSETRQKEIQPDIVAGNVTSGIL